MDWLSELRPLFYPRTMAVAGVSRDKAKFGTIFLRALLDFGFKGKIFPVHPDGGEILGLQAYPSIRDIPGPVDLAAVMVQAPLVPAVLEDCLAKGVPAAEVFTSGFSETGDARAAALERELTAIARRGIRIVGPNCFGVYCPGGGLTLLPGGDFQRNGLDAVKVAVQQSAGVNLEAVHFDRGAELHDVGVSVGHRHVAGKNLQSQRLGFGNAAHGAVRDDAHAT